jgi:hypothetical protein
MIVDNFSRVGWEAINSVRAIVPQSDPLVLGHGVCQRHAALQPRTIQFQSGASQICH